MLLLYTKIASSEFIFLEEKIISSKNNIHINSTNLKEVFLQQQNIYN